MFPLELVRVDVVMVSVLEYSAVDCEFEYRSGQTKDYTIGFPASLLDNVSKWTTSLSPSGLLFQFNSKFYLKSVSIKQNYKYKL